MLLNLKQHFPRSGASKHVSLQSRPVMQGGAVGSGIEPVSCCWRLEETFLGEDYPTFTFLYLALKYMIVAALDAGFSDKWLACFGSAWFSQLCWWQPKSKAHKNDISVVSLPILHPGTWRVDPACLLFTGYLKQRGVRCCLVVGQLRRLSPAGKEGLAWCWVWIPDVFSSTLAWKCKVGSAGRILRFTGNECNRVMNRDKTPSFKN